MKIVERSFEILQIDDYKLVERAGRTCYKSEDKITDSSAQAFYKKLYANGHNAMLEFANMTVKFITDRGVSHELVRHRLCSFAQESTRYCYYKDGCSFVRPSEWYRWTDEQKWTWESSMGASEKAYLFLLETGRSPQEARAVLPNSLKTEIVVKANFREWLHIIELRTSNKAHPDMRATITPLAAIVIGALEGEGALTEKRGV